MRDNNCAMRVKSILSFIAFIAAFGISVTLVAVLFGTTPSKLQVVRLQSDGDTRQNITRFLQQDIRNGQDRNREVYRFEDGSSLTSPYLVNRARAVTEYAAESGAMDDSHLPKDFQLAWLKHMRAWHNYADFLQKAKTDRMSYAEIHQLENQFNQEINSTWYEVLRVGGTYGAFVSE